MNDADRVRRPPRPDHAAKATTLLLTVAGGAVDATMILGFGVLTAAQTGNTILLAVAFAEQRYAAGVYAASSVLAYVVGAAAGELAMRPRGDRHPRSLRLPLGAEAACLTALALAWHLAGAHPARATIVGLVTLAALAMGIQSAAVLRLGRGPATTYVTGTLTTFATGIMRRSSGPSPWTYGAAWAVYLLAAIATGFAFVHVEEAALLVPIAAVVVVLAIHRRNPTPDPSRPAPLPDGDG